ALGVVVVLQVVMFVSRGRRARQREAELVEQNLIVASSEQRLATLLAHAQDAVVIMTGDDPVLWTSPGFGRLLGWEGPIGRTDARDLIHPDDLRCVMSAVKDLYDGKRFTNKLDVRLRHRDGRYLLTQQTLSDCRRDPVIAGIVFSFRDLTEQKTALGELTDEVNRYRFLAENSSEVLIIASAERIVTYASPTANVVLGTASRDLIGVELTCLLHEDDRVFVDAALTHTRWSGDVSTVDARALRCDSDEIRWIHLVARCAAGHSGEMQYHVSLNDISARRDAETAVAASEQRFRSLASQTRELVTMIDPRGIITYVSPSAQDVLGYDHRAQVGQSVKRFVHPDEFADLMHRIFQQSTSEALRHRAIHVDGSYRWLETLAQVLTDQDGVRHSVLLSSRDITDRLQLEHRLDQERGLLAAILDNVHAGVVAVDHNGLILEANRSFCQMMETQFVS
ncbi:MAG: sensor signal transduction histidine kinase, partial [Ilumatobacteraceae bacterium]|nr:sensor signal transduction histidine kinase [Ilumatobacteraceae bacterium]